MAGRLRDGSVVYARPPAARWVPAPGLEGAREGFFVPRVGGFTCLPARYRRLSVGRCSRVASHHYFHVVFPSQGHFAMSGPSQVLPQLATMHMVHSDGWLAD